MILSSEQRTTVYTAYMLLLAGRSETWLEERWPVLLSYCVTRLHPLYYKLFPAPSLYTVCPTTYIWLYAFHLTLDTLHLTFFILQPWVQSPVLYIPVCPSAWQHILNYISYVFHSAPNIQQLTTPSCCLLFLAPKYDNEAISTGSEQGRIHICFVSHQAAVS